MPTISTSEAAVGRREAEIYRAAGFTDPTRIDVPGPVVCRSADDIVASVFSRSTSAPHLFGDRVHDFELALRELLAQASPDARFSEQLREIAADIWRTQSTNRPKRPRF